MTDNGEVVFEEPPSGRYRSGVQTDAVLAACVKRPGQWAVWRRDIKSVGGYYQLLRDKGAKLGIKVEVKAALQEDRLSTVYVRVVK